MEIGLLCHKKTIYTTELHLIFVYFRDIQLQTVELQPGNTYIFGKLGLTIYTNQVFDSDGISFLCRRIRPEYGDPKLRPFDRELLISDTFEFRHTYTLKDCWATLEIPMYNTPDPFEDVYIKTDVTPRITENLHSSHRINQILRHKDEVCSAF